MKYTIERISPSSAAKVVSVTAALLFVVLLIVILIIAVARSSDESSLASIFGSFGVATLIAPFLYMIGVYVATWIFAHAFNIATRLVGGIDVELSNR